MTERGQCSNHEVCKAFIKNPNQPGYCFCGCGGHEHAIKLKDVPGAISFIFEVMERAKAKKD